MHRGVNRGYVVIHTPRLRLGVITVAEDIWVHILLVGVVYPIRIYICALTSIIIVLHVCCCIDGDNSDYFECGSL